MTGSEPPQGLVSFPGLKSELIQGGEFTLSCGIAPSTCVITMTPQKDLEVKPGTLIFTYGRTQIKFPEAAIDIASLTLDSSGQVWQLRILDRRWKWKYGHAFGRYNVRRPDGTIEPGTEKNPRELARLLFEFMGEAAPDENQLRALPDDSRPEVDWVFSNPAQELSSLCEQFGCRVTLTLFNTVWIAKIGEGEELPDGGAPMNAAFGIKTNLRPDKIEIVCGPTKFQSMFALEAVGRDVDGKIKPIGELSYKPDSGWLGEDPGVFSSVEKCYKKIDGDKGVIPKFTEEDDLPDDAIKLREYAKCRDLAIQTVWKWYRITSLIEGGFTPRGFAGGQPIEKLKQILLDDVLIDVSLDKDGVKRANPAQVHGVFFFSITQDTNTSPFTRYPGDFSIDRENHVVMFGDPVVKETEAADYDSATLYLTTSYSVRVTNSGVIGRAFVDRDLPGPKLGTLPRVVHHPEIVQRGKTLYDGEGNVKGLEHNADEVRKQCKHYLDALEKEYRLDPSADVQYAGIIKIETDGAIEQVTWSVGKGQGATTRASRNVAHATFVPSWDELRRREKVKALADGDPGAAADLLKRLAMGDT